jgi:hypothetical protein
VVRSGGCGSRLRRALSGGIPPGLSGGGLRPGDEADRSRWRRRPADYLRELGSSEVHPLLTAWLDISWSRTARIWPAWRATGPSWDAYRAEMTRFLRDYDVILCPAYIHAALPHGESIRDDNFLGFSHTMAFNVAGWPGCRGAVRRIGHRPANRRAGGGCSVARRYRAACGTVAGGSVGRLEAGAFIYRSPLSPRFSSISTR